MLSDRYIPWKVNSQIFESSFDSNQEYNKKLKETLFGINPKVISYQKSKSIGGLEEQKNYFSKNKYKSKITTKRFIDKTPFRIMDAPKLLDDYYLNILDWSSQNQIAVALMAEVYIWNGNSNENSNETYKLMETNDSECITSVSWIQNGFHLAVGTNNGEIQIYDIERIKKIRTLKGNNLRIGSLSWNNHILTAGDREGKIFHYDVRQKEAIICETDCHRGEVCGLKWSLDGNQLASGGNDNLLNIWDERKNYNPIFSFAQHVAAVKAISWCPFQNGLLISGGGTQDKTIKIWNTKIGTCINSIDTDSQISQIIWSKHQKEFISSHGYKEYQLCVWKYPKMEKIVELTGHTSRVLYLAQSPDGETIVSGSGDETLRFWKIWEPPKEISNPNIDTLREIR